MTRMTARLALMAVDANVRTKDTAASATRNTSSQMRCVALVVEAQKHTPAPSLLVKTQTMERQTHNILIAHSTLTTWTSVETTMMMTLLHLTCVVIAVVALEPASALTSTPAMSGMRTVSHVQPTHQMPHSVRESMSTLLLHLVCAVNAEVVCMMKVANAQTLTQPRFGTLPLSHVTATPMLQLVTTQTTLTLL